VEVKFRSLRTSALDGGMCDQFYAPFSVPRGKSSHFTSGTQSNSERSVEEACPPCCPAHSVITICDDDTDNEQTLEENFV
jgi:hypothetical protein